MRTLHDARSYILKLPSDTSRSDPWQTAVQALLLAADGGPMDFARIGIMKALHPREPVYDTSRKDPHWGRRKLVRDQ